MRRLGVLLALGVALAAGAVAALALRDASPDLAKTPTTDPEAYPVTAFRDGTWQPRAGLRQTPIWPGTAPDMAGVARPGERVERAKTPWAVGGYHSEAAFDVDTPTMTVFPPTAPSTGAAVVVFPGGGFKAVVLTLEGTEVCDWLTARGVTCVLLKYRVPDTNHHYDRDCDCGVTPDVPRALQDAQRTVRLVRSQARALGIDAGKVGVMGFSAGGYLVAQTSNMAPSYAPVDAADRLSSRPDFAVAFYPGHLCRGDDTPTPTLDPAIHVTQATPPTFLLQAWDDPVDPVCNATLYARALNAAGVPSEVHLFAHGGHAFALRPTGHPVVDAWPGLVETWLREIRVLPPAAPAAE